MLICRVKLSTFKMKFVFIFAAMLCANLQFSQAGFQVRLSLVSVHVINSCKGRRPLYVVLCCHDAG